MAQARRIDGKEIAARVREEVATRVRDLEARTGVTTGLATVLVGEDPASALYVRGKRRACEKAGIASFHHDLDAGVAEADLLRLVHDLNADPAVHGILVQLPLPKHIDAPRILQAVDPDKDVDGFHPMNVGRLVTGIPGPRPCTPFGVMRMLREIDFDPAGQDALVIGRSNIVGKPMAFLLLEAHATVTLAHSRSRDLPALCRRADLVVAAVGRPEMVRGEWIKEGAVVIDVGQNKLPDGRLVGDVAYDEVLERASAVTPVPGGVGPMTIAMLLSNTVAAAEHLAQAAAEGTP